MQVLSCPNCGAAWDGPDGEPSAVCTYCDARIRVSPEQEEGMRAELSSANTVNLMQGREQDGLREEMRNVQQQIQLTSQSIKFEWFSR
ncbi:MAG: hypothetical protein AAF483_30550, partial [Planctomycetota bacterium]